MHATSLTETDIDLVALEESEHGRSRARADAWPVRPRHGLRLLDLTAVRARSGAPVSRPADQLAALADATWALEREGVALDTAERLRFGAADALRLLGKEVGGELADSLAARADAAVVGDWGQVYRLLVDCPDHRVVALYGPLKTWSSKDDIARFGAIVSVENRSEAAALEAGDAVLVDAVAWVAAECDAGDLRFWHVPGFVPTDVIACGGEANTFPKHFALFLPEDAGFDDHGSATKTIVYANVYETQFRAISAPLGEAVLDPWAPVDDDAVLRTLLVWFRGHDVSHFLGPAGRRVDHLVGWPGTLRGALQEAFADVIGYLVASTPTMVEHTGVDPHELSTVYLSEMLRYYRRGWQWFPDSYAARLELTHLVEGGWLHVDEDGGGVRLRWDRGGLREGLVALGWELCAALVAGDEDAKARLRRRCEHEPDWLGRFEARIMQATTTIGDSLVFGFEA